MSNFVITVFPNESKAYAAVHALDQLHAEGSITLFDTVVVERQPDGQLAAKQKDPNGALGAGLGAVLGSMIGVFGGPIGFAIGAVAGGAVGGTTAHVHFAVSDEFLEDIAKTMNPGDYAVLAEVSERWTAPIDTRMRELGATVIREKRSDYVDDLIEKRTQASWAEIEAFKTQKQTEHAARKAERREGRLDDRIVDVRDRLQRVADKARTRLDDTKRELETKLQALDDQAKKATPEVKHDIEERVTELRKDFGERERKLSNAIALAQEALQ